MAETGGLTVRRYAAADRAAVWSLHDIALREARAHAGHGPWDDDLHNIEETYLKGGGEFLVAELDGEIVAMGALWSSGTGRAELKRMRVNPRYQRRGLGELILEQLETRARELGVRILQLDTTVAQTAA